MNIKKLIMGAALLGTVIILYVSCDNRVVVSDIVINQENGKVFLDGDAYSGIVWSGDEASMSIECIHGDIVKVRLYHANGQVAIESNSFAAEGTFFNENGDTISLEHMEQHYPSAMAALMNCMNEFSESVR